MPDIFESRKDYCSLISYLFSVTVINLKFDTCNNFS